MNKLIRSSMALLVFFSFSFLLETKVWAQAYDEVSYDDLVNQLNKKRSQVSSSIQSSILDDLTMHAGFGLLTSAMQVNRTGGQSQIQMQGFQLAFGIDLFSHNWVAESDILNFGTGNSGDEYYSFRELDMKVLYRSNPNIGDVGYRAGMGLATQYLTLSDLSGTSVNESAPASLFFAGVEGRISRSFSVGAEIGYRSALQSTTASRDSIDLAVRLDAFF